MATMSGHKADLYLGGWDAGDFIHDVTGSASRAMLDKTVLNNNDYRDYQPGIQEASLSGSGWYDTNATDAISADKGLETFFTDNTATTGKVPCIHWPQGNSATGVYGYAYTGFFDKKELKASENGIVTTDVAVTSCEGRRRVVSLATLATRSSASDSSTVDNTAGTTAGGTGYIICPVHTSGTLDAAIRHSTNDIAFSELIGFTNITSDNVCERVEVAGTVNRYVDAEWSGTFNAQFAICFHRK